MGAYPTDGHAVDPLVSKLIALSRNAHLNVDLEDPADYWYRLGQRNAYAYAVGLAMSRGVDQPAFEIADTITKHLSEGPTRLEDLEGTVSSAERAGAQALEWLGPKAFGARYGDVPGIDRDFGMRWGERGDVRISLRRTPDADSGPLYAYDPMWDEYAVMDRNATTAAVDAAFARALDVDVHMDVAAFREIVRAHMSLTRTTVPVETPSVGRVLEP